MIDYRPLFNLLVEAGGQRWAALLPRQLATAFDETGHGDLRRWRSVVDALPPLTPSVCDLLDQVQIGGDSDISETARSELRERLMALHPWRKGPYRLFGIEIDTEWRSDWKWCRVKDAIAPLRNRLVLDVGCGNGYYAWRMWGAGARMVIGIDPTLLSVMQFQAVRRLHGGDAPVFVLPLGIEDVPADLGIFDTVFSMGVLYHRRSPIDHLLELKGCLRSGGELVLETLVIDGGPDRVLLPERRYASMRNVWFLPSCEAMLVWLRRCGFRDVRLTSVEKTRVEEQRSTDWMRFQSLTDFLDPNDSDKTIEGLPAPVRAVFVATA
ncbi:tRNA 5-methoxyuridine(34)/uridine 5-oxyacetic acid(34) synthase CmoB [Methylomonas sp. MV1]|nr:tRNA 5-methoxyuridine(34)/uridine 5-oxyacetic acid(34) synthase CmoB [Methylomonas sp. MV1]MDT4330303.1 tRNA 5-methoxyuridine(34)/uridine 5-oxyacetic acid(34) synthase CmoB [Methylomonas sp. MV1]